MKGKSYYIFRFAVFIIHLMQYEFGIVKIRRLMVTVSFEYSLVNGILAL